MTTLPTLGAAVAKELSGHKFAEKFTATWTYQPRSDRADLKGLLVMVSPAGLDFVAADRSRTQDGLELYVTVQKPVDEAKTADLDALMALVQEIAAFFRLLRPAECPEAVCVRVQMAPGSEKGFVEEHLDSMGQQFTAVVVTTFRAVG